jgi:hypothetical protein
MLWSSSILLAWMHSSTENGPGKRDHMSDTTINAFGSADADDDEGACGYPSIAQAQEQETWFG